MVNIVHGFLKTSKPKLSEQYIYSGNKMRLQLKDVKIFSLFLKKTGIFLDLRNVFFIPHFFKNFVSVLKLTKNDLEFRFINSTFSSFKINVYISNRIK